MVSGKFNSAQYIHVLLNIFRLVRIHHRLQNILAANEKWHQIALSNLVVICNKFNGIVHRKNDQRTCYGTNDKH